MRWNACGCQSEKYQITERKRPGSAGYVELSTKRFWNIAVTPRPQLCQVSSKNSDEKPTVVDLAISFLYRHGEQLVPYM